MLTAWFNNTQNLSPISKIQVIGQARHKKSPDFSEPYHINKFLQIRIFIKCNIDISISLLTFHLKESPLLQYIKYHHHHIEV